MPKLCYDIELLGKTRLVFPQQGHHRRPLFRAVERKDLHIMKKIICKVEYDTDTAELILKRTSGTFGDPAGYEESLYKTEGGKYFLYTCGGPESKYAKEGIKRMSAATAEGWLAE